MAGGFELRVLGIPDVRVRVKVCLGSGSIVWFLSNCHPRLDTDILRIPHLYLLMFIHTAPPPPAANNFLCPPWGSCIPFEGSQTTPASNCETNPIHLWKVGAAPVLLLLGVERSAASSVVRRLSCTVEKGAHPAHTWAPDTVAGVAQKSEAIRCLFSCSFLGSWGWQGTDNGSNDSDALQVVDPQQWGWGWPWVWWGRLSRGSAETFL